MTLGTSDDRHQLVLVTGLSGAGKSTALKALDDVGFHVIDNFPLSLVSRLLDPDDPAFINAPLAIGADIRTSAFSASEVQAQLDALNARGDLSVDILLLDARDDAIIRRFSETRRPHPYGDDMPLEKAIAAERAVLAPLTEIAHVIDTSALRPADLRPMLRSRYSDGVEQLMVICQSFGYAHGVPNAVDMIFDVRFLQNPHYEADLKAKTGLDAQVRDFVKADPFFAPFEEKTWSLLEFLLPRYQKEGKVYLTLAFGCTGGKHRSVMVANLFGERLRGQGYSVRIRHRDKPDEA